MKVPGGNPQENVRQKPHTAGVGNERTADMKGAGVVGEAGLGHAVAHLRENHANGVPHMPLHGMKGKR